MFLQAFEIPSILSVQTTSEKSAGTSISAIDIERVMKGGDGGGEFFLASLLSSGFTI